MTSFFPVSGADILSSRPLVYVLASAILVSISPRDAPAQWNPGHKANLVLGQPNFTEQAEGLSSSRFSIAIDVVADLASGKVFVSESVNNRVLRFASVASLQNGAAAEYVFGQPDFGTTTLGTTASQFNRPFGMCLDSSGNLWVADHNNHRVLRFENAVHVATPASATLVLGQPDFVTGAFGTTASLMKFPSDVAMDFSGSLWVTDTGNNRVLRFQNANAKTNGAPADLVLGQPDFLTSDSYYTLTKMNSPSDLTLRMVVGGTPPLLSFQTELWVSDSSNHRVLRFDNASGKSNGAAADGFLGKELSPGLTQDRLNLPNGVALEGGDLWVSDTINNRLLRFDSAASKPDSGNADFVIGAPDFVTTGGAGSSSTVASPFGLHLDHAGNLWVAQGTGAYRVTRFMPGQLLADLTIGKSFAKQVGDETRNFTGAGQRVRVRSKRNGTARYFIRLQNDGVYEDFVRLRAQRGDRHLDTKWFRFVNGKRQQVTAQLLRPSGLVAQSPYQDNARLFSRLRVLTKGKTIRQNLPLRAWSLGGTSRDRVDARFTGRRR